MKKISIIFPVLLLASLMTAFFISGCKKAEEPGNWTRMTFVYDGKRTTWAGYDVSVQFQAGKMLITGRNEDGSFLQLATDEAVVGNYLVEDDKALGSINLGGGPDPQTIFVADTGVVSITTADLERKLLQGVFDLKLENLATGKRAWAQGSFRTFFSL